MAYDIILVIGELYFDHPLCGPAIIRRLLEKRGYSVGLVEMPQSSADVARLGKPRLFFGVSSGSIDSMLRNYTPLKKMRKSDKNYQQQGENVPNRAVIVYCNWIKEHFKDSPIIIGGVEATLRRFVHYDYWDNGLRRPILLDSRADLLIFGNAEKQILETAERIKADKNLDGIAGTCIVAKEPEKNFHILPGFDEVSKDKSRFCDFQNSITSWKNLAQKIDNRYILQYASPRYSSADLDEYYELPYKRDIPAKYLQGFEFSVVTHRGCIGECNFCSLKDTQGNRIVSRSEESILREMKSIIQLPRFRGNIEDFGGATANMYGMDCTGCTSKSCLDCSKLDKSHHRLIELLRRARKIPGIKKIFVRSGVRHDLATEEYIRELVSHHIFDTLRIAPEHVNPKILKLMNKDRGDLSLFLHWFKKTKTDRKLSFYFMTAHPGSTMKEAKELADSMTHLKNTETFQVFTPTPMTVSTCMYYTEMDPKTKTPIPVPKTYLEKKQQKRLILAKMGRGHQDDSE